MFGSHKLLAGAALAGCVCAAAGPGAQSSKGASSNQSTTTSCTDYDVIDVHGLRGKANEASPPGVKFVAELRLRWPSRQIDALTVPFDAPRGFFTVSGAGLKLPAGYYKSVVKTKDWLRDQLQGLAKDCPGTKVILVGYSQGAQVVGDVYQEQSWPQVVGVVLFGDPYYNHADGSDRFGLNINPKQRIKTKMDGALAAPKPRKAFNAEQVMAFCHQEDPVCQAPLSSFELMHFRTGEHTNYTGFKEPEDAAQYLARLIESGKWPTTRYDGTPALFLHLGASFISPDWSSCSPDYCLVGSQGKVLVFSISDGIDEIARIGPGGANPRVVLTVLGIPSKEIDILLSP